jgi:hypothetical protein
MKNSSDTIENRTCDLPACSSVIQPTAPPCAPLLIDKRVTVAESNNSISRSLAYPKCGKGGVGVSRCFLGLLSIVMYCTWLKVESDTKVNTVI